MEFDHPLKHGRLVQRYKRFLADVVLDDGTALTVTCPNTGSMLGLTTPGLGVWVSKSDVPTRKYAHTLEMVETDLGQGPTLVGINTGLPNRLVGEALTQDRLSPLSGYANVRREVKYGKASRIDILLEDAKRGRCYVEVKNVHLSRAPGLAEFPDCKTERGVKHLNELSDMVREGHRAVMLYLVQRNDAQRFALATDLDPAYAKGFAAAHKAGVEMLVYGCRLSPEGISIDRDLPWAMAT